METRRFRKLVSTSLFALSVLVFPGATWAEQQSDAWITTKTKIALATSEKVSAMDVNVDTVDGRVTLHGMVPSEQAKSSAKAIAVGIAGVKDVRDLLQVVPEAKVDAVEVKDEVISDAVTRALANDEITRDSAIKVQSVNDGVVLLGGKADSLLQHLEAIRVADRVDGVRQVATEVQSGDALYDAKLWRDPSQDTAAEGGAIGDAQHAAKKAGDSVKDASAKAWEGTKDAAGASKDAAVAAGAAVRDGAAKAGEETGEAAGDASGVVKDAWITTAAKTRLMANSEVPGLSVNVDTEDGIVTLFGIVPSQLAKTAAEAEVRKVSGVKDVRNRLEVAAAVPPSDSASN